MWQLAVRYFFFSFSYVGLSYGSQIWLYLFQTKMKVLEKWIHLLLYTLACVLISPWIKNTAAAIYLSMHAYKSSCCNIPTSWHRFWSIPNLRLKNENSGLVTADSICTDLFISKEIIKFWWNNSISTTDVTCWEREKWKREKKERKTKGMMVCVFSTSPTPWLRWGKLLEQDSDSTIMTFQQTHVLQP